MNCIVRHILLAAAMVAGLSHGLPAQEAGDAATGDLKKSTEAVESLVRDYFRAYTEKNLDEMMSFWSAQSPDLAERRRLTNGLFEATEEISLKKLQFRLIRIDGDRAWVWMAIELAGKDRSTGKESTQLGRLNRGMELIREDGRFRIVRYGATVFDPQIIDRLLHANSRQDVQRLLDLLFEQKTDQYQFLMESFTRADTAEERHNLLRNDPHGIIARVGFVVVLNDESWLAWKRYTAGDNSELAEVDWINTRATEVAKFLDDPESLAWCQLHKALVLLAQSEAESGLPLAESALQAFERLELPEGRAAAHVVLGRLAVTLGRKAESRKHFETADRFFNEVVIFNEGPRKTLGQTWAMGRGTLDHLRSTLNNAFSGAQWDEARRNFLQRLEIQREIYGPWSPAVLESWDMLRFIAWCMGDFDFAQHAARTQVEIAEKLYEPEQVETREHRVDFELSKDVATWAPERRAEFVQMCQNTAQNRARLAAKKYEESLGLWDDIIRHRTRLLGDPHLYLASAWRARAEVCYELQKPEDAAENHRRAAEQFMKSGFSEDDDYRDSLREWANFHSSEAYRTLEPQAIDIAINAHEQVLAAFSAVQGEKSWFGRLSREGINGLKKLRELSDDERRNLKPMFDDLRAAYRGRIEERSKRIEIYRNCLLRAEEIYGTTSAFVVEVRRTLAEDYYSADQFYLALEQLRMAQAALHKPEFQGTTLLRDVYFSLAKVHLSMNSLREANDALKTAIEDMSRAHLSFSSGSEMMLETSFGVNLALKDHAAATRDAFRLVLIRKRRLLSPDHPDYFSPTIPSEFDESVIREKSGDASQFALAVAALARVKYDAEMTAEAVKLDLVAIDIVRKLDALNAISNSRYPSALSSLGIHLHEAEKVAEAEPYLRQAVELARSRSLVHFGLNGYAYNLAVLLLAQKRFSEAMPLFREAIAPLKDATPEQLATVFPAFWGNQARCQMAIGDRSGAVESLQQALQLEDRLLANVLSFRSDEDSGKLWTEMANCWLSLVTLALAPDATSDDVARAWGWSLKIKGRPLDTRIRNRQALATLRDQPAAATLARRSAALRNDISALALNPPADLTPEVVKARLERYHSELNQVTGELNQFVSRNSNDQRETSLAELRRQLPPDAALIEFALISPVDWQEVKYAKDRYVAFVLRPGKDAEPRLVDLGEAAPLEEKIREVRELIATTSEQLRVSTEKSAEEEYQQVALELYQALFAPLAEHLGGARLVYVLPDSETQRIALETLVDRPGHYLVEDYEFAYLTSAGDLLRPAESNAEGTWVFAGPDFDLRSEERSRLVANLTPSDSRSAPETIADEESAEFAHKSASERGGATWSPLRHAAEELQVVQASLADSRLGPVHAYSGKQALEEVLKRIRSPRILHLATHGFFLEDAPLIEDPNARGGAGAGIGLGRLIRQKNPYLRSGVVLAGANRLGREVGFQSARQEDGWVTAEEIASLDLQGTQLVVLSACETGLGDIRTGVGVQGLRQAFLYAGARTLVTSLYKVPDESTRSLMQDLYAGLRKQRGVLESLREAELQQLRARREKEGAAHPYFWGSFIVVGHPD